MTYTQFKHRLRAALDNPESKYFLPVNTGFAFIIGFSLPLTVTQMVPALMPYEVFFAWTQWPTNICFTLEYAVRLFAAEKRARYAFSVMGIIDFVSVAPSYLGLGNFGFLKAARFIRFMRIARFSYLFSLSRFVSKGE